MKNGPGAINNHDATAFKFSVTSAVTALAAWASMLLGLMIIGGLIRRRPTLVSRPA